MRSVMQVACFCAPSYLCSHACALICLRLSFVCCHVCVCVFSCMCCLECGASLIHRHPCFGFYGAFLVTSSSLLLVVMPFVPSSDALVTSSFIFNQKRSCHDISLWFSCFSWRLMTTPESWPFKVPHKRVELHHGLVWREDR